MNRKYKMDLSDGSTITIDDGSGRPGIDLRLYLEPHVYSDLTLLEAQELIRTLQFMVDNIKDSKSGV